MAMTCKACGASLADRDRFCVACGMPNVDGSLHPRFGPVAEPAPLFPELRAALPDEVLCVRCERPGPRTDTYCAWCGMEMELAVLAADRADTEGVWTTWGPEGTAPYRPVRALSTLLRGALAAVAALAAAALVLIGARFAALDGGAVAGADEAALADWSDLTMVLLAGVGVLTGVLLVAWCARVARNLVALSVRDARFAPWMALACWFVPVANLVLPQLEVEDLWRSSGPDGPPLTRTRRSERPPFALHLWWPCLALGVLLVAVARLAMPPELGQELDTWRVVLVLGGLGSLVLGVGALALTVVVEDVSARQTRRADALGPPRWLQRRQPEAEVVEERVPVAAMRRTEDGPTWGRY